MTLKYLGTSCVYNKGTGFVGIIIIIIIIIIIVIIVTACYRKLMVLLQGNGSERAVSSQPDKILVAVKRFVDTHTATRDGTVSTGLKGFKTAISTKLK
jgi:flagellar basal body-associated protein FliL